ncbi:prolyl-tRNA editing enzyme YbaK/EbsC (Cys-tRNA(Pro) deacylase) [Sphingobium fontiphilum]|uniref:Prolyl-tRNA editing enzyme YbaK/EbsC (Cys-tRNA(Pro) deacylase) n=1 Tax=Sphingobium fontiphilum TaxID=944425 RepID=A0A7W6DIS6_9SPHN|nr:YbaK/EbsC family protein [Sphingobium fontiphilum]MBB3981420.1 prolyl-tRNA editing enzyme YbaK/EbsC (Cys-tRNA(Pro) deacylase) [Sphingobium fontiphilum]
MSAQSVIAFLAAKAPDLAVIDQGASTATVIEAAAALGVEPARIAKTLSLRAGDRVVLVCARGDARLNNGKAKAALGAKPRMLGADEVEAITGHPVGGVCPFGLATPLPVYCDISLRAFETVFPAAGSRTASVEITPDRLAALTGADWIDICTLPDAGEPC